MSENLKNNKKPSQPVELNEISTHNRLPSTMPDMTILDKLFAYFRDFQIVQTVCDQQRPADSPLAHEEMSPLTYRMSRLTDEMDLKIYFLVNVSFILGNPIHLSGEFGMNCMGGRMVLSSQYITLVTVYCYIRVCAAREAPAF